MIVVAIAGAVTAGIAGGGAQAAQAPCAPQPARALKRCDALDTCGITGASAFQDQSMTKADRVRFYRHCVWLDERWRIERSPRGFLLDPRDHRQGMKKTRFYPLLQRAICEQQGKKPYC